MTAAINETEYTSAYTSLLPVGGGRAARLQYGRRTTPAIFSMLVQLKTEDTVEFGQKLTTVGRMASSGVLEFEVTWLQRHEEDD